MHAGLSGTMSAVAALLTASFAAVSAAQTSVPAPNVQAPAHDCVLIDTDVDIDDVMAIPMVLRHLRVAAVVTTEGTTTAALGGSALARMLAAPGVAQHIPVIVGASATADRSRAVPAWVAQSRAAMERLNGLLAVPLPPTAADRPFEEDVVQAVHNCRRITILAIGPWSSFARYAPRIAHRIKAVVAQGRPLHSEAEGTKTTAFNCEYDLPSCEAAFQQIRRFHIQAIWVDTPLKATPAYVPTLDMVQELQPDGLPGALRAVLMANQAIWNPDHLDPGFGESFLWDQLASLYILHPALFHKVGAHMEPAAPPDEIRRIWTSDTNSH